MVELQLPKLVARVRFPSLALLSIRTEGRQIMDDHTSHGTLPAPAEDRPGIAPAQRDGTTLFVSGQTALRPDGSLLAKGIVGHDVDFQQARECAWLCAENVVRAIDRVLSPEEHVDQILKVNVYVAASPDFADHHLVADAATWCFRSEYGDVAGHHARTAIGVASLPNGSPTEVEAVIRIGRRSVA